MLCRRRLQSSEKTVCPKLRDQQCCFSPVVLTSHPAILCSMTEKSVFRKTTSVHGADQAQVNSAVEGLAGDNTNNASGRDAKISFASLEPREQLRYLLTQEIADKPFCELAGVTFDHRGASLLGFILLDALEEQGFGVDDFDAVGALTAASVPLVSAMLQAAASRGQDLDGFVMDFVYPSIKGPSIAGKRVILLDSWLSEKSYVQTSSLVTLRNGNELSLDFSIVQHEQAQVLAIASLIGGSNTANTRNIAAETEINIPEIEHSAQLGSTHSIEVINPVTEEHHALPFIQVFDESELR